MFSIKRLIVLIIAIVLALPFAFHWIVFDRFSYDKIMSFEKIPSFSLPASSPKSKDVSWHNILNQPFYYLDKGRQSFVFVSKDEKYILKLFNRQRFQIPSWLKKMPLPAFLDVYRTKKMAKKHAKLNRFYFHSYALAFKRFQQQTGLIALGLTPDTQSNYKVQLVDKFGKGKTIDLATVPFVIQKKATKLFECLKVQDSSYQQKLIDGLVNNMVCRIDQLIRDDDLDVQHNYGVIGDEVILIDPGRLYKDESLIQAINKAKELRVNTKYFRKWLKKNNFTLFQYFDRKIANSLNDY